MTIFPRVQDFWGYGIEVKGLIRVLGMVFRA